MLKRANFASSFTAQGNLRYLIIIVPRVIVLGRDLEPGHFTLVSLFLRRLLHIMVNYLVFFIDNLHFKYFIYLLIINK